MASEKLDLLPCKIGHSGSAKVEEYFRSSISGSSNHGLKASYQGYLLHGEEVTLPDGVVGAVLSKSDDPGKFSVDKTFVSFRYWNWDSAPSQSDDVKQVSSWIKLSSVLMNDKKPDGKLPVPK